MDPQVKEQLQRAKTMADMLAVLMEAYKLEECKLGILSKPAIIHGLESAIKILKPERRN